MTEISDTPNPESEPPPKKTSLRSIIFVAVDAFAYTTEHLGVVQGRSLSGAMETALVERLPKKNAHLPDAQVSCIFMSCACGVQTEPNVPVFTPLTQEQAAQLTDVDVRGFAREYLEKVAKQSPSGDVLAAFAALGRDERRRVAEDRDKHGKEMRESLRNLTANSSIMQNWQSLQDVALGPTFRLQQELERAMGPANRATDAIRDAVEKLQQPLMATDAIRAMIESENDRKEQIRSITERMQSDIRNAQDQIRESLEGPAAKAMADLQKQFDQAREQAMERARVDFRSLSPPIDLPRGTPETIELGGLTRFPAFDETPMGRTTLAVEGLREVGARMESAMAIIVNQAGVVSQLIGEVSTTIQDEAKLAQATTKQALGYARFSLVVSAVALGVSAWFSWLGYHADRVEAQEQGVDSAAMVEQLREQNRHLSELVTAERDALKAPALKAREGTQASPKALPPAPTAPKAAPRPTPATTPPRGKGQVDNQATK